ncbi:uncharacterized protein LOC130547803 isoform X2 [Triplophysa rosa]|nr:uncharacterized protein LOC130547803 isoform X2 [Triplophysa rosa]
MSMALFSAISEIFKDLLHEDFSTFILKYTILIQLCNIPLYYSNNSRCCTSQKSSLSTNNPLSHPILITDALSITMVLFIPVLVLLWAFCPLTTAGRLRTLHLEYPSTAMNFTEARNVCQSKYTDLLTDYNEQINKELVEELLEITHWEVHSVKWSDGAAVTVFKLTGNCVSDCCAAMKADKEWESVQCNKTKPFMCFDKGSTEYKLIEESKSWNEAQRFCRQNHTDLVSIRNESDNEEVKKQSSTENFWIGLQHSKINKSFTNFANQSFCIYHEGKWIRSISEVHAVCYKSLIHMSTHEMSWEGAVDYCNASGLLRIESKDDQIETEKELRKKNISEPVWIGLRQSRLFGFWMWVNGLHVGPWTNWKGGRQPEHQISHHCDVMEKVDGTFRWTDKDCRYRFRVVCEIR